MSQPNVTRSRPMRHHLPPRPVGPRVEQRLALRWGCEESTAHGRLLVLAQQAGDVVSAMIAAHQYGRAISWMDPIIAAVNIPLQGSASLQQLVCQAQNSDVAEEICETRYLTDPSPANRAAWQRALADQEHDCRQLRLALLVDEARDAR